MCYQRLSLSKAGPKEKQTLLFAIPCESNFLSGIAASEMRTALSLMSVSKKIRGHMKQCRVSFNSVLCYGRARSLFNLM